MYNKNKLVGKIVDGLRKGKLLTAVVEELGIRSRKTVYNWMKADPRIEYIIKESMVLSKDSRVTKVHDKLYNMALEGNITACIFFLKNQDPENWKDVQDGRLNVTHQLQWADFIKKANVQNIIERGGETNRIPAFTGDVKGLPATSD